LTRLAQAFDITTSIRARMLSSEILDYANRCVLCWLATVDKSGQPSVSPKEIFAGFDAQHLVVANIASPRSVRNVEANPRVCISFIDVFVQKGFKILGTARIVRKQDADYLHWVRPLQAMAKERLPIHSVIVICATEVELIVAPSYRLHAAETTEQSQVQSAMRAYRVQPERGDV
jgi:uncharacterized protein